MSRYDTTALVKFVAKNPGTNATEAEVFIPGHKSTIARALRDGEGTVFRREGRGAGSRWFVLDGAPETSEKNESATTRTRKPKPKANGARKRGEAWGVLWADDDRMLLEKDGEMWLARRA